MYKYSQIADADGVVSKHMEKLVSAIEGKEFESLVLYGSYGKGEGGFVNGSPVNDYDILLVGGDVRLEADLRSTDVPIEVEVLHVDSVKDWPCSQQSYEIKYGSQLLAGKPLELPDWKEYDIPYADALESLNKRVLSMLVGKYEMMKEEPDYYKVQTQIGKMILALGDAVLLKRGVFNPSYRSRLLMLGEDNIVPYYAVAVSHKLFGIPNYDPDGVWNLWNITKELFRQYVVENQANLDYGEMLINFDERITPETLKSLLEVLGAGDWL
jgi:hypothetical protein